MYNIYIENEKAKAAKESFGEKYDLTDDISQANSLVVYGDDISPVMLANKLLFAVTDISGAGSDDFPLDLCSYSGISVFQDSESISAIDATKDFIENGNISASANFPDVSLGPFGDEASRIAIAMHDIDEPILMAAMIFSNLDPKAIAGGTRGEYGYALIAARKPVTSVPKVDGIVKVRVLQDI